MAGYVWTDEEGRISRAEVYDDWDCIPAILKLCTGLDDHKIQDGYGKWIGDAARRHRDKLGYLEALGGVEVFETLLVGTSH